MHGDDESQRAPSDTLGLACRALIVDIIYHAIKDRRESDASAHGFADEDHEFLCSELGFGTGAEEIEEFAMSAWFERLFIELYDVRIEDVRCVLFGMDLPDIKDVL